MDGVLVDIAPNASRGALKAAAPAPAPKAAGLNKKRVRKENYGDGGDEGEEDVKKKKARVGNGTKKASGLPPLMYLGKVVSAETLEEYKLKPPVLKKTGVRQTNKVKKTQQVSRIMHQLYVWSRDDAAGVPRSTKIEYPRAHTVHKARDPVKLAESKKKSKAKIAAEKAAGTYLVQERSEWDRASLEAAAAVMKMAKGWSVEESFLLRLTPGKRTLDKLLSSQCPGSIKMVGRVKWYLKPFGQDMGGARSAAAIIARITEARAVQELL